MPEPEVPGQLRQGRPLDERECLREGVGHIRKLIEVFTDFERRTATARTPLDAMTHLHAFRDCMRGVALNRMDMRWLLPARVAEMMQDQLEAEYQAAGQGGAALVYRTKRWTQRIRLLREIEHNVTKLFDWAGPPMLIIPRAEGH